MKNKKCVVIGVSGGIAVYKALEIVSALKKKDVDVRVIMTDSATKFVTPLSFQSLSQNNVVTDMFAEPKAFEIQHISLAQRADVMLIAPATANIIGKVANGISDDMLSTTIMATKSKVIFAPAMNTNMYENVIVQNNIKKLISYGYEFIEPAYGRLACGDIGQGKLADVNTIVEKILEELNNEPKKQDLKGKKVLVSAGPTIAPIDPVRFITNRSTGKMGYNLAQEARDRGAEVILVSGPTSLEKPKGVEVINITTNEQMKDAILEHFHNSDIVI
ncbi:MAG: bifunctional phosphopantothenoylcysteine decarboxylase/phosphopantothenate--cysteine ligase CoaBC, partial [Clostridium sp.]